MRGIRAALLFLILLCLSFSVALAEMKDGEYIPTRFTFTGGSGRVTITCPRVTVTNGTAMAELLFSSPNYTRILLGGTEYPGVSDLTTTRFLIPAELDHSFTITATTLAMSQPHDVAYTLYIGLGDTLPGLTWQSAMEKRYADCFDVDFYEGGYALIKVRDGDTYLLIPENAQIPDGLDPAIICLQQPLQNIYVAATSAMALLDRLQALDRVRFSGTQADGWFIDNARTRMQQGEMVFAGKYSEPDYELLVKEDCDLAIESTMISHTPKVQEMLTLLGIPVFVDHSSYETHPLGRTEWIRLYGVLLGCESLADAFFEEQVNMATTSALPAATGRVAFFYLSTDGHAIIRGSSDYIARMIEMGGAVYAFPEIGDNKASVSLSMEDFYDKAGDADYLIYNGAIDESVRTLSDLLAKSPLLKDFSAVTSGHVYLTGRDLYQATDRTMQFVTDIRHMLSDEPTEFTFLSPLTD